MPNVKTDTDTPAERRIELLSQALRQVVGELGEANKAAGEWKGTSNYYFDRYHDMRIKLVKTLFAMPDMNAMIRALTENQEQKPPDIKLGDDFNVT